MSDYFEDDRGWIKDLAVGDDWAVTRIFTKAGAKRGNHYHKETKQTVHVISGRMLIREASGDSYSEYTLGPGDLKVELPNKPHAWQALEDTDVLVVTHGPRSGENYESDTFRLKEPLL